MLKKQIITALVSASVTIMMVMPAAALPTNVSQSHLNSIIKPFYCPTCNAVGIAYAKKDYKRSDFTTSSTIQYNGSTYYFSSIDDNLTTNTHWWTIWIKQ
ncbi:hypothetical protein MH117_02950 [Paenibacillus sp. ACRRX]|uniref:hypothetical protein n=1 Tax=Paenibacillus sp. ACRRX TaxID=2918206 RepID=UPI001EF51CB8|nr:hypothetical protein [Paenibacillus sp. ACRRX]MCG7406360.1 hypothetical protein [Paenibacillus sp. ACRRX]